MRACPILVDKEYKVYINQMSPNGKAMANIKGVLVFIANAKLGNHLKIKITNIGPFSADAEIINHL
jgi:predicted RNA-binding protein with TRAM domain